jgi:hypothetical protein
MARQARKTGCPCEVCGTPLTDVIETRPGPGYVRRRRKCFNGHLFTTFEFSTPRAPDSMVTLLHFMLANAKRQERS